MVKITFKNVGQGDSIVLEWEQNNNKKIGIIDCNKYKNTNPILNHIITNKSKEIEFLILSHPHRDHFSGFTELLTYCKLNEIKINKFLHTSEVNPHYLRTALRSIVAEEELVRLFILLKDMRDEEILEIFSIENNPNLIIPLTAKLKIEVLAPSSIEKDKYIRGENYPFDEESSENNPNANWLSTILKISDEQGAILLTSDVESVALTRILKGSKGFGKNRNDKLVLAQAPHHGSRRNLNKSFWQLRTRAEVTPIVISVGENSYNHPSNEVIEYFRKTPNYKIYSTNLIGSLVNKTDNNIIKSQLLNIISKNIESNELHDRENDLTFTFKNGKIAFLN